MSLAELFVDDDLSISVDPETYQDQANPAPPLPGVYRLVVVGGKILPKTDTSGQKVITDGRYPVLVMQRVKIVEPVECEKEFGIFAELRTKPFDRFGTVTSDVGDFTRAMDQTRQTNGMIEGVLAMEELVAQNTPFAANVAWTGYDSQWVEQEFERLGVTKTNAKTKLEKTVLDAVYKGARLGTKDFKSDGKGGLVPQAKGKSGAMIEARAKISKYIPSLTATNLGPFRIKA